jgi:hypothetical protein
MRQSPRRRASRPAFSRQIDTQVTPQKQSHVQPATPPSQQTLFHNFGDSVCLLTVILSPQNRLKTCQ